MNDKNNALTEASQKQPTLRDVAKHAGVSPASVSRYLNNSAPLPPEMSIAIEEAIGQLGYRRNVHARRLSLGITETIGFVTSDIASPFFAAVASGAEEEAERHGCSLLICNTRNQIERELEFIRRQRDGHFDGLIFMTNHLDNGQLRDALRETNGVALVDEDVPGAACPRFFIDNVQAGILATDHLISNGHRRIAHLAGPAGMLSTSERLDGYRTAIEQAGISFDEQLVVYGSYSAQESARSLARLLQGPDRPTAVFASSDQLALGVYSLSQELNLSIPNDLSVVGFDDFPHLEFLNPPLTTIRQPARELGRRGVAALFGTAIDGSDRLPVELVIRQSVCQRDK